MFLLSFLFAFSTHAQVFEGPITAGMAGTGRAGLDANEGAFLNPALAGMLPKSEFAAYYKDGYSDVGQHRNAYGATISENSEDTILGGNIAYLRTRNTGQLSTPVDGEIWHAAFGKLFLEKFAVGFSVYRFAATPVDAPATEQWNGSIGGVFLILPKLGVAYVYDNPIHPSSDVPNEIRFLPQQSFGVFWSTPYLARLRLDLVHLDQLNPDNRWDIRTSVESEVGEFFLFRLGGRWDEIEGERYATAGLSFNGPKLKVDYAFEKNVARTGGAVHSVDLRTTF
jgi:hypothetical protein